MNKTYIKLNLKLKKTQKTKKKNKNMVPAARLELAREFIPTDFKSVVSTDSTKQAPFIVWHIFRRFAKLKTKKIKGFILLEVCIFIIIMGIVGVFFLSTMTQFQRYKAMHITNMRMENILKMFGVFLLKEKYLPTVSEIVNGKNNGEESGICSNQKEGAVPYKALGISENDAKDGFGNWILYKVATPLCISGRYIRIKESPKYVLEKYKSNIEFSDKKLGVKVGGRDFCGEKLLGIDPSQIDPPVIILLKSNDSRSNFLKTQVTFYQFLNIYANTICDFEE